MDTLTPAQKWAPYAYNAGKQLGIDPAFVLAQWLYETGNGTNLGSTKYNNLAGIKSSPNAAKGIYNPSDSQHAGYTSLSAFTQDYVKVMNLGYYRDFLSVAKKGSVSSSLSALNASPWSEADYNTMGFMKYYNQAAKVVGGNAMPGLDFDIGGDILNGVNTDNILNFLKTKWWLIAGALVIIAVVKR
jgi:hypothetical protein